MASTNELFLSVANTAMMEENPLYLQAQNAGFPTAGIPELRVVKVGRKTEYSNNIKLRLDESRIPEEVDVRDIFPSELTSADVINLQQRAQANKGDLKVSMTDDGKVEKYVIDGKPELTDRGNDGAMLDKPYWQANYKADSKVNFDHDERARKQGFRVVIKKA